MKKLIIILSILFLAACASPPGNAPQEFILKVQSDSPVKVDQDQIVKSMEVPNPSGKFSYLTFLDSNKGYIKISSGIGSADVTNLWNDLVLLDNRGVKDVVLFISSPGGDAFSGLALADEIERARCKGFTITAHASGIIASAAVPVLAVCSKRLAAPGTIFMVHEAAIFKWISRETASDIRSQSEMMELLRARYMDKMEKYSSTSREDWEAMEGKTTWFSAEQAKTYGIVDQIE